MTYQHETMIPLPPATAVEPVAWVSYKYKDGEVGSQYDNHEASAMLAIDGSGAVLAAPEAVANALEQATVLVRDALGAGAVPRVQAAFPQATVQPATIAGGEPQQQLPASQPAPAYQQPAAPAPPPQPAAGGVPTTCPNCGKKVYDNRQNKLPEAQGGKGWNPKGPDFACSDKQGCGWVQWPPR